jgi:hypothetical protein
MKIGTQTVGGQEVEIDADPQSGRWTIKLPGSDGFRSLGVGTTLEAAIGQAQRAIAKLKVRVAVPFIMTAGEKGTATGRHAGNRDILCRLDGRSERLSDHARVLRPDTPVEELAKLTAAQAAEKEARREQARIENEYRLELGRAVDVAIEAMAAEQAQQPAAAGGA